MARNVVELTEEDLDDPALAFLKMAEAMKELRRDFADVMTRTAPDYRPELKILLTALKAIQDKPALALETGVLEEKARRGAESGTREAVAALRLAAAGYGQAQQRETALIDEVRQLSWGYYAAFTCVVLLLGVAIGFLGERALANREERAPPTITLSAEKVAALLAEQFPGICPKPSPVPQGKR